MKISSNLIDTELLRKPTFYTKDRFISRSLRSTFLIKTKLSKNSLKPKYISFDTRSKFRFDLLNVFYTLIICGDITLASERLSLSQPAVSLCINKLEKQLGTILFRKLNSKKSIQLTASGIILFNYIQRLFQITQEAIDLSNCMLLNVYDSKLKFDLFNKFRLLNRSNFNKNLVYPKHKFFTFTVLGYSLRNFVSIKIKNQRIFETNSKFLLVKSNCNYSTELAKEVLSFSNKLRFESIRLDRINSLKLLAPNFTNPLTHCCLVEIQTINAFVTCNELEISNLLFWGSEL